MSKAKTTMQVLLRKAGIAFKLLKSGKIQEIISGLSLQKQILQIKIPEQALKSNSLFLERIDVIVTQRCTLKCKSCSNLMQYFNDEKKAKDISLADICRDFDLLMQRVDFIRIIEIMGGEPLLFKDLPALLQHISKHRNKYGLLRITTNGTIVPAEDVLMTAAKLNAVFMISNYGKISANLGKLKKKLKRHHIPHRIAKVSWYKCRQVVDGTFRTEEDIAMLYRKCDKLCNTLVNGRFYHCPFLAHGESLRAFPANESNHVNLLDMNVTKVDMLYYKSGAVVPLGCQNCSGGHSFNGQPIPVAEQTKNPIIYKTF